MSKLGDHKGKSKFTISDKMFETRNVPGATKLVYHRVQPESDDTSDDSFIDQYAPIHA